MTDIQHIDIQCDKTIDWCVSRGQLPQDWLLDLKSVQNKVKNALVNPAYEIPLEIQKQMEEEGLTYWSCLRALETLSSSILTSRGHSPTDVGKLKNFFGSFTDPSLKALSALIGLYRKHNLYLAEGARALIQAVNYDLPQLKKTIQLQTKQSEDLVRKISEEQAAARDLRTRHMQELKENWKITKLNSTQLEAQLKKCAQADIPELINHVIQATKDPKFGEAIEYYREFIRYSLSSTSSSGISSSSSLPVGGEEAIFPTLQLIRASELMEISPTATAEDEDEKPPSATSVDDSSSGVIDWGIEVADSGTVSNATATAATIDWDITAEPIGAVAGGDSEGDANATGGIDWGIEDTTNTGADGGGSINWDIETTESGSLGANESSIGLMNDSTLITSPASAASAPSSSSPLDSDSTRHAFLGELLELETFLAERYHDLATSDDLAAAVFQGQGVPHILTLQSQQTTQTYLSGVRVCLSALRSPRLTQLLMIRSSKRSLDRTISLLRHQESTIARYERSAIEHEQRRLELIRLNHRAQVEFHNILAKTKEMKSKMEAEISRLFQNRPVHIVGEINNLLATS